jgi:hypothetical protein
MRRRPLRTGSIVTSVRFAGPLSPTRARRPDIDRDNELTATTERQRRLSDNDD